MSLIRIDAIAAPGGGTGLPGDSPSAAALPVTGGSGTAGESTGKDTTRGGGGGKRRSEVLMLLPGVEESPGGGLIAGTTFNGCREGKIGGGGPGGPAS